MPIVKTESYKFDIKLDTGRHTVEVDSAAMYGYFENNATGSGGGLWFSKVEGKDGKPTLSLQDYDGVFCLPMRVIRSLRLAGIIVEDDFE